MFAEPRSRRVPYLLALGAWLALISVGALSVVTERHFQVDEFQNAYSSRLLFASGGQDQTELFLVALGHVATHFETTSGVLLTFRGIFFLVFVVNLLLAAHAQRAFLSPLGRWLVLVAFSLLFPLWAFGMEIRHDNLLLTGQLALFFLTQRAAHRGSLQAGEAFLGGMAMFWTLVMAYKGLAYALPYGVLLLLVHRSKPGFRGALTERAKLAGWLALGCATAAGGAAAFLISTGHLGPVLRGASHFAQHLDGLQPFSLWPTTSDEVHRYPHLFALSLLLLAILAVETIRRRPLSLRLGPGHVTAIYLVWSFVVLWMNPRPFPYNQLNFLPFVFFAAIAMVARLPWSEAVRTWALLLLAVANGVGWANGRSSEAYARTGNRVQLGYIRAAEALTDPTQDSVLDGVGMVVTRKPPDRDWLLHSSYMSAYRRGERTSFGDLLKSAASPVVMTNYRWGWLPGEEWSLLRERYLPLAKDFWVLGGRFVGPEGHFRIYNDGRYFVTFGAGAISGKAVIDGQEVPLSSARYLARGLHSFAGAAEEGLVVSWAGPRLETPIALESLTRNQPLLVPF